MKTQCQRSGDIPVPIDAKAGSWKTPVRVIEADGWERAGPSNDSAQPWRQVQLGELLREPLRNGHSAKETNDPNGIRTLTLTAVTKRDFSLENTKITCADPKRVQDMWLKPGDILIERANTPEYVGLAALYEGPENFAIFPDLMIRVRIDEQRADTKFIAYKLLSEESRRYFRAHARSTAGNFPKIDQGTIESVPIDLPPLPEQKKIAHILSTVQRAIEAQERIIQTTTELKKALMHKLFTEGLRGEPQKQTDIGPIPESWATPTVESVCTIKASAMSYSQLEKASNVSDGVRVLGVKVSDMNLPGNEIEFRSANLERLLTEKEAHKRTVPPDSIIFPKRGAAIATNKKRLTTVYTVLDPNLVAVTPSKAVSHRYLFHWFNTFDLKKITDPGPTPQLNKKDIAPLMFPMPPMEEQQAIAAAIDAVEEKSTLHNRKRAQLQDLFRTLLHELMTAKIRVHQLNNLL